MKTVCPRTCVRYYVRSPLDFGDLHHSIDRLYKLELQRGQTRAEFFSCWMVSYDWLAGGMNSLCCEPGLKRSGLRAQGPEYDLRRTQNEMGVYIVESGPARFGTCDEK